MGAREKNFYNELFQRYGWVDEAKEIQDLFLSGHREEAIAKVPDEYVDLATLAAIRGTCASASASTRTSASPTSTSTSSARSR